MPSVMYSCEWKLSFLNTDRESVSRWLDLSAQRAMTDVKLKTREVGNFQCPSHSLCLVNNESVA